VIEDTSLTTSVTMPTLPVAYEFSDVVTIGGGSNPVLTVSANAILTFALNAGLEVGVSPGNPGGLVLRPGATLTSASVPGANGDWAGVTLGSVCSQVDLQGATLSYGGSNNVGELWIDQCSPVSPAPIVDALTLTNSSSCGLYLDSTTIVPTGIGYAGNTLGDQCP
jgi:hypothetical protein